MKEHSEREVMDMVKDADVAVMGTGTVDQNSALIHADLISIEEFKRLQKEVVTLKL
ncbi:MULTISPECIES: sugar-binding domain-containing protein [unclassified Clostridium]|uniref:sugar-binding domain-containing protein n=1 Tax=unclassified Clostridium TaxID=2614128 RepID=UPI001FAB2210|nr:MULTISPECIES: sugar-binding domain-containing protein [unclassified Clostridium]